MDLSQAASEESNSHSPSRGGSLGAAKFREENNDTLLETSGEMSENQSFESFQDDFHPPNNNTFQSHAKDFPSQIDLLRSTLADDLALSTSAEDQYEYGEDSDANEEAIEDEERGNEEEEGEMEEEEEEEDGRGECDDEDMVSEEEEVEEEEEPENVDNVEESFRSKSSADEHVPVKENAPKRGFSSLYSGMNDIISESSSISSSPASTPSVTPTKMIGNGPSRLQAALTSSLSYKGSGGGLLVHHPVTPKKRVVNKTNTDHLSEELNLGYRILMELMSDYQKGSNAPFMEAIEMDPEKNGDYLEVVTKPMWLKKIREQLLDGKYESITEVIGDIRTMLENAYRYHGPAHSISKKGLRLEHMMEQKIALLPKEVRELCTLERTSGMPPEDITQKHRNKTARISVNGDNFFSYVLYRVRGCRVNRDKEMKKRRMEALKQAKKDRELEVVHWEEDLLKEPINTQMRAMWELPQIGHFIFLTLKTLNIYEVPQFELERMLLMPKASRTLAMLLTSLLSSPQQRQKLSEKPYMPYKVWARKLAHKTLLWYRCYSRENQDPQKVFDQMGIEPEFWQICGPSNPFERQLFHEMTFHQRVWLLKSLCDYLLHNHKTVQEVMSDQPEADQREYNLGRDRNGNEYLHFPQFCGQSLRIYRRARVPSPEIHPQEDEVREGSILPLEKIKEFKKMVRKFRHKYEEEAEWEGSKKKKKKKRRRVNRVVDPEEELVSNIRSRPGNLRQRPRARYNDQYEDLGLSSDDEPKFKPKNKKSKLADSEDDDEELEESVNEKDSVATPPTEANDLDDEVTNSSVQSTPQEGLTRSQQKNPKVRKGGKKKPTCELCGKSFHTIAALKGHRAVHTKEKQKLANEAEANQALEKPTKQDESSSEISEEKNDDGKEKLSNEENSHNEKLDNGNKSEHSILNKERDLKRESLVNGEVKDKSSSKTDGDVDKEIGALDGQRSDMGAEVLSIKTETSEDEKTNLDVLKREIKEEEMDIKVNVKKESIFDSSIESVKEENKCDENSTNKDINNSQRTEVNGDVDKGKLTPSSPSCDSNEATKDMIEDDEETTNSKSSTPALPTEPNPIHDPSPYLPRIEDFELVVTSVEQLRQLILKFGDLPEGNDSKENSKEEESKPEKKPACEVKLHRALSNLLTELSPWETKLLTANKKLRTKLRNQWNDFVKRGADYVDPAEEAWMSDPEPEPEPTATPQESSSSSSSSEESLDEEGNPKRKLRKRRAKRQAVAQMMESAPPLIETPVVPTTQANPDSYAVSSRGRVRKVKKIINYDGLDFEKLAMQASLEAEEERVRKKRRREEEEKEREEQEKEQRSSNVSFGGVQRYLLSQTGRVSGYIDNEGQVHSANTMKEQRGRVDISSVRNLASQLVTSAKKESPKPQPRHMAGISKVFQNTNLKPDVPSVVVAAYNNQGSPVYVRVVGEQALQLVKYMKPGSKGPVSQIKLQHHGQTYTVNTNAQIMTKNIPGIPNEEKATSPSPNVVRTTASTPVPTSTYVGSKPCVGLGSLATSSAPSVPRVAPITTVVSAVPNPPNTLALAYRGLTRPTRPVTVTSGMLRPQGSVVRGVIHQDLTRPSTAPTRLVTASPSVVSSVMSPSSRPSGTATSLVHVNHQVNRPGVPTVMTSPVRPSVAQVVSRVAGTPTAGHVATTVTSAVHQASSPIVHHNTELQQVAVQSTPTQAVSVISQPQGQAITAATVVVPAAGGQPQLKLESESLAQLMQRTGSKIIAMPNGRGGYTLSLTPGAVSPGQKNQTHIAANTAAKVQVVTSASTALLQEASPTSPVQHQVIQQQTLSPPGGTHQTTVVQGIQGISRQGGVSHQALTTQQVGLRQVIPVTSVPGTVIKTNNIVTQGTQLVLNSGQQNFARVSTQPRVYTNLVATQTSPQPTRTSAVSAATVLAPQQTVNTIVNANQQTALVQNTVGHKVSAVQAQASNFQASPVQQQYVVQQRVIAQPAGTQHQVVRLQQANPSQAANTGQRLTVQIVQQPGGGQQIVQMVPQVVSQASMTSNQQGLIYVQGPGQVIAQQKTNLAAVQQSQLQTQSQPQQLQIQSQQQQHVVTQAPVIAQQVTQHHVAQVAQQQQQVTQVTAQQIGQATQQQIGHVAQQHVQQVAQVVQQTQPQQTQQTQGRLVLVRTNQGEQMALHHPDGRLMFLTQEQLQAAIRNNAVHSQTTAT